MSRPLAPTLKQAAAALASGTLAAPALLTWLSEHGVPAGPLLDRVGRLATTLKRTDLVEALTAMSVAIDAAMPAAPELVLTDSFDEVYARDSRVAAHDVIVSATTSLTISGYSWRHWAAPGSTHQHHPLFEAVWKHMRTHPTLKVRLILHLGESPKGPSTETELRAWMDHELSTRVWPWPERPSVYIDLARTPGQPGVMHAKVIVADRRTLLLTSANPTESAYSRSIEAGVLLRRSEVADQMEAHFDDLIGRGVLVGL